MIHVNNTKNNGFLKVALVTGAARRIGAKIARILHENGFNVVLHYHTSQKEAEDLCEEFNKKREHSAVTTQAHLVDEVSFSTIIDDAIHAFGRLDVLVNNASRFYKTPKGKMASEAWNDLINSNVKAPFFLAEYAAPYLAKHQGSIIHITDIHGESPLRDYSIYCISKAALIMATKVQAKEWAPEVRVNAISPGAILWPEHDNALSDNEKEKIMAKTALQRHGNPSDIAEAVWFLVNASYMTGQVLSVDGGRTLFL